MIRVSSSLRIIIIIIVFPQISSSSANGVSPLMHIWRVYIKSNYLGSPDCAASQSVASVRPVAVLLSLAHRAEYVAFPGRPRRLQDTKERVASEGKSSTGGEH